MTASTLQRTGHRRPRATSLGAGRITVRPAGLADLEAILNIGLNAMPLDPQWNWRFPNRTLFPDDNRRYTREMYREFLENSSGNWRVMLAERFVDGTLESGQPMAFAVWNLSNLLPGRQYQGNCMKSSHGMMNGFAKSSFVANMNNSVTLNGIQSSTSSRRDAKMSRMKAWKEETSSAKANIFDSHLGQRYFQLQILATHPNFHRQGAGTKLCKWGQKLAQATGYSIAVFASPMGKLLYTHLGFKWRANVVIRAPDENEYISISALVYEPCKVLLLQKDQ